MNQLRAKDAITVLEAHELATLLRIAANISKKVHEDDIGEMGGQTFRTFCTEYANTLLGRARRAREAFAKTGKSAGRKKKSTTKETIT